MSVSNLSPSFSSALKGLPRDLHGEGKENIDANRPQGINLQQKVERCGKAVFDEVKGLIFPFPSNPTLPSPSSSTPLPLSPLLPSPSSSTPLPPSPTLPSPSSSTLPPLSPLLPSPPNFLISPPSSPNPRDGRLLSGLPDSSSAPDKFESPQRYYRLQKGADGKFSVEFSPGARKHKRGTGLIYTWKNMTSGKKYIGKTYQDFTRRVSQHVWCANNPDKDAGKSILYQDMQSSDFAVGVLGEFSNSRFQSLEEMERNGINKFDTVTQGYNKSRGGGGGTITEKVVSVCDKYPLPTSFKTPETKARKIKVRKNGSGSKLFVELSPDSRKKSYVVYGFRRDDGRWYIGKTTQCIGSRLSGHHYAINHPEKDKGMKPLPVAIRNEPNRWKFYILYQGPHIVQVEELFIDVKDAIIRGFNQNGGGGGPSGKPYVFSSSSICHDRDRSGLTERDKDRDRDRSGLTERDRDR